MHLVEQVAFTDIAQLFELLHSVFLTEAVAHGLGYHFDDLTPREQQNTLFWISPLTEPFAVLSSMFGRISFAVFLLYIIGPADQAKKWSLWAVIGIQLVANLVTVIQIYSQCGDKVSALWDYSVAATATCASPTVQTVIAFVQSGLNSVCDISLTILPALVLWKLNMPTAQKIGLLACLTLSILYVAKTSEPCKLSQLTRTPFLAPSPPP